MYIFVVCLVTFISFPALTNESLSIEMRLDTTIPHCAQNLFSLLSNLLLGYIKNMRESTFGIFSRVVSWIPVLS